MSTLTTIRLLPKLLAMLGLAIVIGFAVFAAVVGLSAAVSWVGAYVIPWVVVLGALSGALWLFGWALSGIPAPPNRDHMQ